jgi:uncharacterized OsmC-like protein/alpha/beta superfamily hydrolase
MATTKLSFDNGRGQQLAGLLDLPAEAPRAFAILTHCFTCGKDLTGPFRIAKALADNGIATLRFDFTGIGDSEGDFVDTSLVTNVDDIAAAAAWLRENHAAPALLIGHSLGGTAVLLAAAAVPECTAVVTIAAPCDPEHVLALLGDVAQRIEADGQAEITVGPGTFTIGRPFLEALDKPVIRKAIHGLRRALLVCHSPLDNTVGIDSAEHIYRDALHPKSFLSLDNADHLVSDPADAKWLAGAIAAWAERYVTPAEIAAAGEPETADEWVTVTTPGGGFRSEVRVRGHRLVADEPTKAGGTDEGMTPYELLDAALGTCTTMTLKFYAEREGIPLTGSSARVRHGRVHAADCADCSSQEGYIHRMERELTLEGELTDAQRADLLRIADKCPVHKTLSSEIRIDTKLREG